MIPFCFFFVCFVDRSLLFVLFCFSRIVLLFSCFLVHSSIKICRFHYKWLHGFSYTRTKNKTKKIVTLWTKCIMKCTSGKKIVYDVTSWYIFITATIWKTSGKIRFCEEGKNVLALRACSLHFGTKGIFFFLLIYIPVLSHTSVISFFPTHTH